MGKPGPREAKLCVLSRARGSCLECWHAPTLLSGGWHVNFKITRPALPILSPQPPSSLSPQTQICLLHRRSLILLRMCVSWPQQQPKSRQGDREGEGDPELAKPRGAGGLPPLALSSSIHLSMTPLASAQTQKSESKVTEGIGIVPKF
jgi:hypothetical protein